MLKTLFVTAIVGLFLFFSASQTSAQWKNLGSKEVTDRAESDVFHVSSFKGQFRALRFNVSRRPIRFYRMEVTYGNGERNEIEIRDLIPAGGKSRVIDLPGKDRYISRVKFWYEAASIGSGKRSYITLWGRK
ncbi:MAG: hypothetical protein ACJ72Z_14225 [Pyrinomonadaceae bacterium]